MNCDQLPETGAPEIPVVALLIGAMACLAVGLILLTRRQSRGSRTAMFVVLMLAGCVTFVEIGGASQAQAVSPDCIAAGPATHISLTIKQTSVITGLAPGISPAAIRGVVSNSGPDSTFVAAITVSIAAVVRAPGSADGRCDASDYVLLATRMPVGKTMSGHSAVDFSGASIGFSNKSINQDPCKRATVILRYMTS